VVISAAAAPSSCSLKLADIEVIRRDTVANEEVDRRSLDRSSDNLKKNKLTISLVGDPIEFVSDPTELACVPKMRVSGRIAHLAEAERCFGEDKPLTVTMSLGIGVRAE
jgi:hypothetical protein